MKRSPLKRGGYLKRYTRLRPVNRKRRTARFAKTFGVRAELIRQMWCAVAQRYGERHGWGRPDAEKMAGCEGTIQAAHVKSRGAGGDRRDLVSLCWKHHSEQHQIGIGSFARLYDLDLRKLADENAARFDAMGIDSRGISAVCASGRTLSWAGSRLVGRGSRCHKIRGAEANRGASAL